MDLKQRMTSQRDDMAGAMGDLLHRAQATGDVRSDIELDDLFALVMGTCASAGYMESQCSQKRMLSVVCDGLRAERTSPSN